jgi:hypothetical protein
MAADASVASHSRYCVHRPRPPLPGGVCDDFIATALIVTIPLPEVAPCAIDDGLGVHVAPVSPAGTVHVIVTAAGNGVFASAIGRLICTVPPEPRCAQPWDGDSHTNRSPMAAAE